MYNFGMKVQALKLFISEEWCNSQRSYSNMEINLMFIVLKITVQTKGPTTIVKPKP